MNVDAVDGQSKRPEAPVEPRTFAEVPIGAHQLAPSIVQPTLEPLTEASQGSRVSNPSDAASVRKARVLILFAGPASNPDNLQHLMREAGLDVDPFDLDQGRAGDLSDDAIWDPIYQNLLKGHFDALFASPPCSSFSRLRGSPNGPPAVRGVTGPDRYGFRTLDPKQSEYVRLHNLLAVRTAKAFKTMVDLGRPAVVEQPAWRSGETSMYSLDEFVELAKLPGLE